VPILYNDEKRSLNHREADRREEDTPGAGSSYIGAM
jgi:hypothetical protein